MSDTKTKYLGLELKSPVIAGASGLTADMESLKKIESAGAGAVVIRSLFEEEIQAQRFVFDESMSRLDNLSPEAATVVPRTLEHGGPEEHLLWTRRAVEALSIPVIGSLNAVHPETWEEYAKKLEQTGIDALELNLYASPGEGKRDAADIEREQAEVVARVAKAVKIPIAVKLSPFYTSPVNMIRRLAREGVRGMVLFNAFLQPNIDIDSEQLVSPLQGGHNDSHAALRMIGLTYGAISADLCGSGGIQSGEDVIRMILAGATAVQVVGTLYRNGIDHIRTINADLKRWQEFKGYASPDQYRGKLSRHSSRAGWVFDRAQYAKLLMDANGQLRSVPVY